MILEIIVILIRIFLFMFFIMIFHLILIRKIFINQRLSYSLFFEIFIHLILFSNFFLNILFYSLLSFFLSFSFIISLSNSFIWIYFHNFVLNDIYIIYSWLFYIWFNQSVNKIKSTRISSLHLILIIYFNKKSLYIKSNINYLTFIEIFFINHLFSIRQFDQYH